MQIADQAQGLVSIRANMETPKSLKRKSIDELLICVSDAKKRKMLKRRFN